MAAIGHSYVESTADVAISSGTMTDITGMSIASSNFTAGKKYLLIACNAWTEAGSNIYKWRIVHGSTGFADSQSESTVSSSSHHQRQMIFEVWTAVDGEAIKLQHSYNDVAGGTSTWCSLLAINLSDDVTENTDWFFAERATDDTLTSTPTDGASVTFTPSAASDWLVLTNALIDAFDTTTQVQSSIIRSGEASSSVPYTTHECLSSTSWFQPLTLMRVFSCTNTSNTFKEQSVSPSNTGHIRLHSRIFALNLNKFRTKGSTYTDGTLALNTPDYGDQLATLSFTPEVTGDCVILASYGFDKNSSGNLSKSRIQIDEVDAPSTENISMRVGGDNADAEHIPMMFMDSLTAAGHTIDLDGSVSATTSTPAAQHRTIIAFSMELASTGTKNLLSGKLGFLLQGKL